MVPATAPEELDEDTRARIAVALRVLTVAAEFTHDVTVLDALADGDLTAVLDEDLPTAVAAERRVRALAPDALGRTDRHGRVISTVLADEYLLDDFLRICEVEQHLAFDHEPTAAEDGDRHRRLEEKAEQSAEVAASAERRRREHARLCTCGEDYGRHFRNQTRDPWVPRDHAVCYRFRNVDEVSVAAVTGDTFRAGWTAWLTARGLDATQAPDLTDDATQALRAHRGPGALTVGEMYAAYAATLGLAPVEAPAAR